MSHTFRVLTSSCVIRVSEPFSRALALVGTRFRPLGRNPKFGLDCIGLVIAAFDLGEVFLPAYRLSDGSWAQIESVLDLYFCRVERPSIAAGDLVVSELPKSFHFAVLGPASFVHADLRLGRVVETPHRPPSASSRYFRRNGVES